MALHEMNFQTTDENCELFLSAEGVGFLMLSASGISLRKWQGLIVEDTSICAGIQWRFGHTGELQPLGRQNWILSTRDTYTVNRYWNAHCGCRLKEKWNWTDPEILSASLEIEDSTQCQLAHSANHQFSAVPQWTLSPAGYNTCGHSEAKLSVSPASGHEIQIEAGRMSRRLRLRCKKVLPMTTATMISDWQPLSKAHRDWLGTPKDASRGETHQREILTTHEFSESLKLEERAEIQFIFNLSGQLQQPTRSSRAVRKITFESESHDLKTAFVNSTASLDQLIQTRSDGQLGLQAGLPWFTQFWTRDMCHSFRAAFLWSGRFKEGETLICDLWRKSRGTLVPNYTTSQTTTNNSIDALPLLLLSTADLLDYCGWSQGIRGVFSEIQRYLIDGARIFSEGGLVRHGPSDTWMDAQKVAPDGRMMACSPRADRAFEIQAFWIAALRRWSRILREDENFELSKTLVNASEKGLETLYESYFDKSTHRWADTIRPDHSKDFSIRPNVFLGLLALHHANCLFELMSPSELKHYLEHTIEMDLVVPYGVRTLSPETAVKYPDAINEIFNDQSTYIYDNKIHFHPYHEFGNRSGLEHPDWAYHNGTIWPWLSQSCAELLLLSGLSEFAGQLRQTLIFHSTKGAQGGALPELLDGLTNHSRWSWPKGAPHQAWSEACLIQLIVEGWIGIKIKDVGQTLVIKTSYWSELSDFTFNFEINSGGIQIKKSGQTCLIQLSSNFSGKLQVHHCETRIPESEDRIYSLSSDQSLLLKLCFS